MTPREIAQRLADDCESVCRTLLPNGERVGHEWCSGSVHGDAGSSLKVRLDGQKAGVWKDFADSGKGGDLLDLWRETRGQKMATVIAEAKRFLGIKDDKPTFYPPSQTRKQASMPAKAAPVESGSSVEKWFAGRQIPSTTMAAYRIKHDGNIAIFPCYHDENLMMLKYRDTSQPKKIWASADSTPALFGWSAIPDDARTVIITEGEIDAMSYHAQGHPALSVPFGAGTGKKHDWIEYELDRLERFDVIYVSTDMDEEGEKAADDISARLGRHRCLRVSLPKKDANEVHMDGLELWQYLYTAKSLDPQELRAASSYLPEVIEAFFPTSQTACGCELPWSVIEDDFRLRPGELTIWAGINGHGKTQLLDHIAVHSMAQGQRWCVASMEMLAPIHLKRLFRQIGTVANPTHEMIHNINAWIDGRCWMFGVRGTAKAAKLLEVFRYAWQKYGIQQFVVDSLAKCGYAEDDYNGQKGFVEVLQDFAIETKTHVHLVVHSRKRDDEDKPPNKLDIKGTGAITDMADNVAIVWRNKPKEEKKAVGIPVDASQPDAMLIICKQRNHQWEGRVKLMFDQESGQYRHPNDKIRTYLMHEVSP